MRALSLVSVLFLVVGVQAAPRAVTTNTTSASLAPNASPLWKHISASTYISTASTLTFGSVKIANQIGSSKGSGDASTDSAFGFNARYSDMIRDRLSFHGGLSVETRREVSSTKLSTDTISGTFPALEKPAFRPFIAEAGLRYDLNKMLYATVGLNYTVLNILDSGEFNSLSMDPAIGYQAAIGGSPFDRLAFELQFRDVRYSSFGGKLKGSETRIEASDVALNGLNLGARYSF